MSDTSVIEYELYTLVRLRDMSVGTIVDRMGNDYIVDTGHSEADWETIIVHPNEIVCKAVFDKELIRKKVVITAIDGKEYKGIVDDIYHDEEDAEGVLSLLLIWKEVNGMIAFHEQEIQQIKLLDYEEEHYCPVYKKVIDCDLCYESLMVLNRSFKVESLPEMQEVKDIEESRAVCKACIYSDLS